MPASKLLRNIRPGSPDWYEWIHDPTVTEEHRALAECLVAYYPSLHLIIENEFKPDEKPLYLQRNRAKEIDIAVFIGPHRIALEVVGGPHYKETTAKHDAQRTRLLQENGWLVLPFNCAEVEADGRVQLTEMGAQPNQYDDEEVESWVMDELDALFRRFDPSLPHLGRSVHEVRD